MKIEGTRMTNIKYLSITEFAEKAGVSKQAIYKQISNAKSQLAPYVYRDGKQPLIEITALSKLYGVEIENSTFQPTINPFQPLKMKIQPLSQPEIKRKFNQSTPIQPEIFNPFQPITSTF